MKIELTRLAAILLILVLTGCAAKTSTSTQQMALTAYQSGDYDQASKLFKQLTDDIPKDAELWFKLGNSYAREKKPQQAIEAYQNALLRAPDMTKAWYNMGIIQMQIALKTFIDMGKYSQSVDAASSRGKKMREGLMLLLQDEPEEKND
ncbi:MAG: tetratricopeptide repeat protein [Desulforhopalus sp.]